jgi:PhnB protein
MTKAASYIPADCHAITPYLLVSDINQFIDFLVHGLSGKVREKIARPDGSILHAQVMIADSLLMIGQPQAPWKPLPVMLYHYVPDCDATYKQALAAGATSEVEPADMFYGDRHACVKDVAGNSWWIATHMEDMSAEEIQTRAAAFYAEKAKQGT